MIGFDAHAVDSPPVGYYRAEGMIKNVNTIEEYRNMDKSQMIVQAGRTVRQTLLDSSRAILTNAPDLGCHQRWDYLLVPLVAVVFHYSLICRPQKVQVLLLVCLPRPTL